MPGITRKAQAAETEAALKASAVRVFDRQGYLNTKITDITADAGRSAGSFYNHFKSKEELLEALLADLLRVSDEEVLADDEHSPDLGRRDAIRWHVSQYWNFFGANKAVLIALRQAALVDQRFADRVAGLLEPDVHHLADHLAHCARPEATAVAIAGLCQQFAYAKLVEGQPVLAALADEDAIDLLTGLIDRGING
ncbi:TetR/AcrR family transcriptional regulator [Saccharopolyspora dendranthemae]|uniref:TetR family transcriptional regulator n=1 Tax=Saccharopolyspora dendranthemae TaxID=1181886 RepID=A0A561VBW4_9PSEU|nr:TetR/AcrR family transcriptional regulator [Saccharopolyspora dendranthemae]TWG09037.1 TetR family transcriptional regulator [Saccharopolyspora dendranthemae]